MKGHLRVGTPPTELGPHRLKRTTAPRLTPNPASGTRFLISKTCRNWGQWEGPHSLGRGLPYTAPLRLWDGHMSLFYRACVSPPRGGQSAPVVHHMLHTICTLGGGGDEGLAHGAPAHLPVPLPSLRDCVPRSAPAAPALPPRGTDLCPELANTREPRFTTQDAWY